MKMLLLAILCGTLTATARAGANEEEALTKARKELAGTWQAVSYALNGAEASEEDMKRIQLVIDADGKTSARRDGKTFIATTIKIDPSKTPRHMDITFTEGEDKGQVSFGIYKIEGDTLTILALGGYGIVSVASHLVGTHIAQMIQFFLDGNTAGAARVHHQLMPLVDALFATTSPIPLKYALNKVGMAVGGTRLPLVPIDTRSRGIMDEALAHTTVDLPVAVAA